jgi:hypothetical protein
MTDDDPVSVSDDEIVKRLTVARAENMNGGSEEKATKERAIGHVPTQVEIPAPQIYQYLSIAIRGLLVSAPGADPALMMQLIAHATGHVLSCSFQADLSTVLKIRGNLKTAFADGVTKAQIVQTTALPEQSIKRRLGGSTNLSTEGEI